MTLSTMSKSVKSLPGDSDWPLGKFIHKSDNDEENETLKSYFMQLRLEVVYRLLDHFYKKDQLNKWWMMFSKKKFMNLTLQG